MTELTTMTPKAIDTILAELWNNEAALRQQIAGAMKSRGKFERAGSRYEREVTRLTSEITTAREKLGEALKISEPYGEEYRGRPWNRYFLVTNSNGHIHRGTNCSTCHFSTQYAWLIELADCDENAMVEQYGEKACTICFPNAPVHPAFIRTLAEREAAEAAKAKSICRGGNHAYSSRKRHDTCKECGAYASVTPNCSLRAHARQNPAQDVQAPVEPVEAIIEVEAPTEPVVVVDEVDGLFNVNNYTFCIKCGVELSLAGLVRDNDRCWNCRAVSSEAQGAVKAMTEPEIKALLGRKGPARLSAMFPGMGRRR